MATKSKAPKLSSRYPSSRNSDGRYTAEAQLAIARFIQDLNNYQDQIDGHKGYDYYEGPEWEPVQMEAIAERLDTYAIWFAEYPNRWIKGDMRSESPTQDTTYCVMGLDENCKRDNLKVELLVDFDRKLWNKIDTGDFMNFCDNSGVVSLNDATGIDVPTFAKLLHRTATALREHAQERRADTGRTWQQTVNNVFWRQRKTVGLVK